MLLSRWFESSGIDRLLAPVARVGDDDDIEDSGGAAAAGGGAAEDDASAATATVDNDDVDDDDYNYDDTRRDIWEFVAPRLRARRLRPPPPPAAAAVAAPPARLVECVHCGNMTPADGPTTTTTTTTTTTAAKVTAPPDIRDEYDNDRDDNDRNDNDDVENDNDEDDDEGREERDRLHDRVLRAAYETAMTSSGPTFLWERKHNLFQLCAAPPKAAPPGKEGGGGGGETVAKMSKNLKKLHRMLVDDVDGSLGRARSANMSSSLGLPDGYTMLHAACHAGNVEVAGYLLSRGGVVATTDVLDEVDVQGRTALHVASDRGHVEVVLLLRDAYDAARNKTTTASLSSSSSGGRRNNDEAAAEEAVVGETMAGLSLTDPAEDAAARTAATTTTTTTTTTPVRSPAPPPSSSSSSSAGDATTTTTFAGRRAPVDLSGRTPLAYAATSPVPKARRNRNELERILYSPGDRSVFGQGGGAGRTPPRARCGPSPRRGKIAAGGGEGTTPRRGRIAGGGEGSTPSSSSGRGDAAAADGRASSYLSPNPRRAVGGGRTPPGSVASTLSNFATPFQSPHPAIREEEDDDGVDEGRGETEHPRRQRRPLLWGASEMNGWRIDMEDKILVNYDGSTDLGLFGVFDGHGDGGHASDYVASNLWGKLISRPDWAAAYRGRDPDLLSSSIVAACCDLDNDLRGDNSRPTRDGGTTAIIALVCDRHMIVANVGDSRCILVRKKRKEVEEEVVEEEGKKEAAVDGGGDVPRPRAIEVIPMSEDHKPNLPGERARIESAGLSVQTDVVPSSDGDDDGVVATAAVVHRVRKSDNNLLGVSRAFGDYDYKSNAALSPSRQAVVCTPEIVVRERADGEDLYLILACDGIWDVMSNDDVGEFVTRRVEERRCSNNDDEFLRGEVLARVGDELLAACLNAGSRDNMSVLIVAFPASCLVSALLSSASLSELAASKRVDDNNIAAVENVTRALAYE